jgi:hypothetical protein
MVSSIVELNQQYEDQLVVIGIDARESPEVVRSFVEEHDMTYLNLIADAETLRIYRLGGHPFTVLVSPEGRAFGAYRGYTDKATLELGVRALLELE